MKKLIVIADWANDSLTCQESRSAIEGFLKDPTGDSINFVSSYPSTIHTSFLLSQITKTEERYGRPHETVMFVNTDTRSQTKKEISEAKGADFIIALLKTGVYVVGPNSGYSFSLIKHKIDKLFIYNNLDRGSQFRSRDLYSRISAHMMDEMEDELDLEEIQTNFIPELSGYYVAHIDNFGNIKTTIRQSEFKGKYEYGDKIDISINNVKKSAKFVNNLFGGGPGILVIYPGSSGNPKDPYMEITVWRHFTEKNPTTGLHEFNAPKPGMEIEIR